MSQESLDSDPRGMGNMLHIKGAIEGWRVKEMTSITLRNLGSTTDCRINLGKEVKRT